MIGDGRAEMEYARIASGLAIGVASTEDERAGIDAHKRSLLIAAGDDYASNTSLYRTPLSPVLPASPTGRVIEEPFKAAVTTDGFKHPVTQSLPGANHAQPVMAPTWGRWFRQAEVRADRGRTVMEGADHQPLLVLDRKGKGRVALLTSDQAWLWARGYEGGGPHTDLLRRLSHWLMKEPDLEEERLIASAHGLKLTLERRSLEETVGPVVLSGPGGDQRVGGVQQQCAGPAEQHRHLLIDPPGDGIRSEISAVGHQS